MEWKNGEFAGKAQLSSLREIEQQQQAREESVRERKSRFT
jgi:hypothetical protein